MIRYQITSKIISLNSQAVAIAAAGTAALNKVATAVQAASKFKSHLSKNGDDDDDLDEFSKKLNWKSKAATDDVFNEEEKIQLGLRE